MTEPASLQWVHFCSTAVSKTELAHRPVLTLLKSATSVCSPPLLLFSPPFCPVAQKALHEGPCPTPTNTTAPDWHLLLKEDPGKKTAWALGAGWRPFGQRNSESSVPSEWYPEAGHVGSRWACPVSSIGRVWPEGGQDRHLGNTMSTCQCARWAPRDWEDNRRSISIILKFFYFIHFIVYVMY